MNLLTEPQAVLGSPPIPPPDPGHRPVLLAETLAALAPRPGGCYLDGTFGGGGHSRAILAAAAPGGLVLALDADPEAIARAERTAADPTNAGRLRPVRANFADLAVVARREGMAPLDGVLLDLGLSSFQLDAAQRGFAFRFDGPLDMRFDPDRGRPAADLVNGLPPTELADLLFRYGEEPKARRIAQAIERERGRAPIVSTARLAEVVSRAVGGRRGRETHPATRTFQALRIATNDELGVLERALAGAVEVLAPGGRLAVIAFHSLEDRIVKRFVERESADCVCPPELPVCVCDHRPRLAKVTRRPLKATPEEVAANPRSRSAVLRVAERLGPAAEAPTDNGATGRGRGR
ncbi:MAG: 16S rRNA (cytosine(1402)-N(4))-methyltransferase [uncultured Thermomicrobiales bacterium]|uniref:Ribosomal RNA small subunit methyltransferase H n=1 Tax=uncultured Thermomicrobiales bacterium TaxID=1645740 RepID=A0A6J4VUQ1_9BACT|nr:MAG: 16S rRNA (cytosine(1402)-N(4))-methyltransferase [uncultured Thermomicrobiales bacterium]